MKLAPEGWPFILGFAAVAALAWTGAETLRLRGAFLGAAWVFTVLTVFSLWFFRDPAPRVPSDPVLVLAPGQGKVVDIREVDEPTFMGGPSRRISIFLSVFDVHVQRAPLSGTVAFREYRPGRYAVAWLEKASEDNEQASLGLRTDAGPVLVRQIAGLVARRIVTDPREGDAVRRGERIGLIRFGSRVDLFLPLEWEVRVEVGDRVRVGRTVVARQVTEESA
ncbi:MAG: phosphatidylserine decarboxylase family protein [Gemmatimonadota bacterium]